MKKNYDFKELLKHIRETQEYYYMEIEELLELEDNGLTYEEDLLNNEGDFIVLFDDESELLQEELSLNSFINRCKYKVDMILKTINGRICVVLIE